MWTLLHSRYNWSPHEDFGPQWGPHWWHYILAFLLKPTISVGGLGLWNEGWGYPNAAGAAAVFSTFYEGGGIGGDQFVWIFLVRPRCRKYVVTISLRNKYIHSMYWILMSQTLCFSSHIFSPCTSYWRVMIGHLRDESYPNLWMGVDSGP